MKLSEMAIDAIMGVLGKFIPTNEATKLEMQAKLAQIEVDSWEAKATFLEKMGTKNRDGVIPLIMLSWLIMHIIMFLVMVGFVLAGKETPIIPMDKGFSEAVQLLFGFLFGSKTASRFSKPYVEAKYNKGE